MSILFRILTCNSFNQNEREFCLVNLVKHLDVTEIVKCYKTDFCKLNLTFDLV